MKWLVLGFMLLSSTQVSAKLVNYSVHDELFQGYFTSPEAPKGLIVLIHDWDGMNEYEIKRADMLHEAGYAVFAIDLFGKGIRPAEIAMRKQQTGALYRDRERMRALVNGAMIKAQQLGSDTRNSVILGYCFGGTVALEMARSGLDAKGFVITHGSLKTPEHQNYKQVKGEILVQHGTADAGITMAEFAALAVAMEKDGAQNEMTAYSGVGHSFTKWNNDKYDPVADEKAWLRLMSFLQEKLYP